MKPFSPDIEWEARRSFLEEMAATGEGENLRPDDFAAWLSKVGSEYAWLAAACTKLLWPNEWRERLQAHIEAIRLPDPPAAVPEKVLSKPKRHIPRGLAKQVFERDAYRCRACGGWEDLQTDHVHPESKGGLTTLDNLQTLCGRCNRSKGSRLPEEARA